MYDEKLIEDSLAFAEEIKAMLEGKKEAGLQSPLSSLSFSEPQQPLSQETARVQAQAMPRQPEVSSQQPPVRQPARQAAPTQPTARPSQLNPAGTQPTQQATARPQQPARQPIPQAVQPQQAPARPQQPARQPIPQTVQPQQAPARPQQPVQQQMVQSQPQQAMQPQPAPQPVQQPTQQPMQRAAQPQQAPVRPQQPVQQMVQPQQAPVRPQQPAQQMVQPQQAPVRPQQPAQQMVQPQQQASARPPQSMQRAVQPQQAPVRPQQPTQQAVQPQPTQQITQGQMQPAPQQVRQQQVGQTAAGIQGQQWTAQVQQPGQMAQPQQAPARPQQPVQQQMVQSQPQQAMQPQPAPQPVQQQVQMTQPQQAQYQPVQTSPQQEGAENPAGADGDKHTYEITIKFDMGGIKKKFGKLKEKLAPEPRTIEDVNAAMEVNRQLQAERQNQDPKTLAENGAAVVEKAAGAAEKAAGAVKKLPNMLKKQPVPVEGEAFSDGIGNSMDAQIVQLEGEAVEENGLMAKLQDVKEGIPQKASQASHLMTNLVIFAFCIGIAYCLASFVTTYIAHPSPVEGESMEPTLSDGDTVIIQRLTYYFSNPKRFDVIVFPVNYENSEEQEYYIKRVIGLPGETVQIIDGSVYINGSKLTSDKYALSDILEAGIAEKQLVLGDNQYFVMGDNRNMSTDSRNSYVGLVNKNDIVGEAWICTWPLRHFGSLKR